MGTLKGLEEAIPGEEATNWRGTSGVGTTFCLFLINTSKIFHSSCLLSEWLLLWNNCLLSLAMTSINIKGIQRNNERNSDLIFIYTRCFPLKMRMARRKEGDSLMEGDVHGNNTSPSRRMVTLVIAKENALESIRIQLGTIRFLNMDVVDTSKYLGRKGGTKRRTGDVRNRRLEIKNSSGHLIHTIGYSLKNICLKNPGNMHCKQQGVNNL